MPILAEGMSENLVHQRVPSLATGHEAAVWSLKRAKNKPIEEKILSSMGFRFTYSGS